MCTGEGTEDRIRGGLDSIKDNLREKSRLGEDWARR